MKWLYRLRVQALTGNLVVQKCEDGMPQPDGRRWVDCTEDDLLVISVIQTDGHYKPPIRSPSYWPGASLMARDD